LIAEETAQSGDTEKSQRLLAAQKNLADAKKLLGEISAGEPAAQKLARLASFPELNINPILEISLSSSVEYINPSAQKLFPGLKEKGSTHPYLTGWQEIVERFCREPALYLDREVQVEGRYYQQTIIYIKEHNCIRVYGRDVTVRKNAEQALQQSEKCFRTLIDKAPVAIALSRESKFLYVNPTYLEMHGITSPAELIGHPIYERVASESLDESRKRASQRAHGLPVERRYEYSALCKDGSLVPVIAAVTSVTLADGPATVGFF
jgi:PAS domain S-box-containing protein